jgi:molybdate transport system ATP-binding protein
MTIACRVRLPLGRFALDVDFTSAHRVTGIFGPSGAGKSSLLEAIIGLRPAARGRIALDEHVWLDSDTKRGVAVEHRDVGYVPQDGLLFPHLTVQENLAVGARRAKARGLDVEALHAQAIDVMGLGALLDASVRVLSGGERQRVALARALCSGPRLLVLDEPLASLDVAMQHALLPFLRRVREAVDVPMLLVSHAPLEVSALCDHVIALEEGKIVASGTPAEVLSSRVVARGMAATRLQSVFEVEPVIGREGCFELVGTRVAITTRTTRTVGRALIAIPSDAVILAPIALHETTASNVLQGRVTRIDAHGAYSIVHVMLAEAHPPLLAEVTEASIVRLSIVVGAEVTALFKASSCEVL